jgi:hypothetical protein
MYLDDSVSSVVVLGGGGAHVVEHVARAAVGGERGAEVRQLGGLQLARRTHQRWDQLWQERLQALARRRHQLRHCLQAGRDCTLSLSIVLSMGYTSGEVVRRGGRWPRGQCARRMIVEPNQH